MYSHKKKILIGTGLVGALCLLIPPWQNADHRIHEARGFHLIFNPPVVDQYSHGSEIDLVRLLMVLAFIGIAGSIAYKVVE